jgi:GntR family transcriptional regulator
MEFENLEQTKLDRTSDDPLYRLIEQDLLAEIDGGQIKPGQVFPPERELCERYGVSRITVRRAMRELEEKGYIHRKRGSGTFVAYSRIKREIGQLTGFSEEMRAQGRVPGSRLLNLQHKPAGKHIASLLDLNEGDPIWIIERLRLADGEVVSLSISHLRLPPDLFLTPMELSEEISLWSLLETKGVYISECDLTVKAIVANAHDAELLGVEVGDPLLVKEGVNYSEAGIPVEAFQVLNRADAYQYSVHMVRQSVK